LLLKKGGNLKELLGSLGAFSRERGLVWILPSELALDPVEVLLGMAADLCAVSGANVVFDLLPVLSMHLQPLDKELVLLLCPSSLVL